MSAQEGFDSKGGATGAEVEGTQEVVGAQARNGAASNAPVVESPTAVLLRLAAGARLYRSSDGTVHAEVPVGGRYETFGLKSAAFRH
jgi:hypothetical protein